MRQVDLLPAPREELPEHKAASGKSNATDLVFPTRAGGRQNPSNIRNRTLRVYRHGMRRDDASKAALAAVVGGDQWCGMVRDHATNTLDTALQVLLENNKAAY